MRVELALLKRGGLDPEKPPARLDVARRKSRNISVRDDAPDSSFAPYESHLHRWIVFVDPNSERRRGGAARKPGIDDILARLLQHGECAHINAHHMGSQVLAILVPQLGE